MTKNLLQDENSFRDTLAYLVFLIKHIKEKKKKRKRKNT